MITLRTTRGDKLAFDVVVSNEDGTMDLGVCDLTFSMKRSLNDQTAPLLKKTSRSGAIAVTSTTTARVTLTPQDTASLPNESRIYKFDVKVKQQDGSVFTVLSGDLEVRASASVPATN